MTNSGTDSEGAERLPRVVWALAAIAVSVAIGFGIVVPAVPGFAQEFGVGRTAAALVVSMFAAARVVTAFGGGRLVDRFGARPVLVAGLLIVAVSSALAGMSQSYLQLLALRGVGGFGSAMFSVSSSSLLATHVPASMRGRAMSIWSGGFLLGGVLGPVVGGPLTEANLRLPFFFYAGSLVVAAAVALVALPRVGAVRVSSRSSEVPDDREGAAAAWRIPLFRAAVVANVAGNWAMSVRMATIPLFVTEALLRGPTMTGWGLALYAVANGAGLWPAGRLSDTWGRRPVMIAGGTLTAVSMGLFILPPTDAVFLIAMVLGGLGSSMQTTGPSAVLGDVAAGRRGSVIASYQIAGDIGMVIGPLVVNGIVDLGSYPIAFGVTTSVVAAATLFAIFATGRTQAPAR